MQEDEEEVLDEEGPEDLEEEDLEDLEDEGDPDDAELGTDDDVVVGDDDVVVGDDDVDPVAVVDEAEPVVAKPVRDEEDEEDEDEEDSDDVEASLDVILKERLVVPDEEDDDEEGADPEDRGETPPKVLPKQPGEFVCQSCFLVKHPSQLADRDQMLCRDCV